MFTYTVDEDLIVHVLKDETEIDQVGPWDSAEGAESWGAAICSKYNDNPTFVYPDEKPPVTE
jgi:hypothetical protein